MRSQMIFWLVLALSTSAFGARRVTVQDLTKALISFHDADRSDEEVAASLKQLQLSEGLTASEAAGLAQYLPGALSREQLLVLRELSSFEPAAPSMQPTNPAPDAAAQSALLARAGTWVAAAFGQAPTFTASKVVGRFEEGALGTSSSSGSQNDAPSNFNRISEGHVDAVEIAQGVERALHPEPKVNWGENGQVSDGGPSPTLPELFQAASAFGKLSFSRWEAVDGKPMGVFTFGVEKKKSHYEIDHCCFPSFESDILATGENGVTGPAPAVMGKRTWRPFKKVVPFHGLLYIDPDSGAIVRTVTIAELKPFDYVHTEEVRIDYATVTLGGKSCAVPVRKVALNEIVPGADTRPFTYPVRRELVTAEYNSYRSGGQ